MKEETQKALAELAKAVAKSQGMNPEEITFSVCQTGTKYCEGKCDFKEEYYGNRCTICGLFYAHGQAPWEYDEDAEYESDQEEYAATHGTCADCFGEFGDGWSMCTCNDCPKCDVSFNDCECDVSKCPGCGFFNCECHDEDNPNCDCMKCLEKDDLPVCEFCGESDPDKCPHFGDN